MKRKVYNFSPGPGMLPDEVLERIRHELVDWNGCGMSVLEMSHRGKEFGEIIDETEADLRELLGVTKQYHVLFLQGGGHLQFAMVPLNLTRVKRSADYICTGYWTKRAVEDASQFCDVNIAASSEETGFDRIPEFNSWRLNPEAAYVHYVTNDTAAGVEFSWVPETGDVPLVGDMSTNILTKKIDIEKHALVYACAQKNIGVAGLTIVIVREDLIGEALPFTPRMLNYKCHVENRSMFNTPCTFAIYVAGLVIKWVKNNGGLQRMVELHAAMSGMFYKFIDSSSLYENTVLPKDRSRINIPFKLRRRELENEFVRFTEKRGLTHLRGNLALGLRASMYNAMPVIGVQRLIDAMAEFESLHK